MVLVKSVLKSSDTKTSPTAQFQLSEIFIRDKPHSLINLLWISLKMAKAVTMTLLFHELNKWKLS